jgi:hypothetical protein
MEVVSQACVIDASPTQSTDIVIDLLPVTHQIHHRDSGLVRTKCVRYLALTYSDGLVNISGLSLMFVAEISLELTDCLVIMLERIVFGKLHPVCSRCIIQT